MAETFRGRSLSGRYWPGGAQEEAGRRRTLPGARRKRRGPAGEPTAARVQPAGADVPLSSFPLLSSQHPHPSRHLPPRPELLAPPRNAQKLLWPNRPAPAHPATASLARVGPPRGGTAGAGLPGPNPRGGRQQRLGPRMAWRELRTSGGQALRRASSRSNNAWRAESSLSGWRRESPSRASSPASSATTRSASSCS